MPQPYIFVYQTICQVNGKSYIGVHKTDNLNDGYIGCGIYCQGHAKRHLVLHKAVRKYGYENFKRYELDFFDDYKKALDEERHLVTKDWVTNDNNYNSAIGGEGNTTLWMSEDRKSEWKNSIKNSADKWVKNGGLEKIRERSKTAPRVRMFGKNNPMFGTNNPHTQKIVLQFDLKMNFIKKFTSLTGASKSTGSFISSITYCCKGVNLSCNGYIYRYENYSEKEKINLENNLNRKSFSESEKDRFEKIKKSFIEKGRKDSICIKNKNTGEIIFGVTALNKIYTDVCFGTIKNSLKLNNQFRDWVKIN